MFQPVPSKVNFARQEEEILQLWHDVDAFRRTETEREGSPLFVLYEGPPTANGEPGIHHVLSRVFKDIIPRYKTMRGYRPFRKGGWDTHGLPVELEVEKELGISSKREIEEYGIEAFNRRCRESVFRYVKEWERLTERIAFWIAMEDAYVTYHNSYIETGWWIVRRLWDQGLVYRGMSSVPHCPRCVTTLSSHEVALGYKEDTPDPSVYILFPLADTSDAGVESQVSADGRTYLMAWTTTPWTLPGNTALAVSPYASYVLAELADGRRVVLAQDLVGTILEEEPKVLATFRGMDLEGARYQPLYNPFDYDVPVQRFQEVTAAGAVEELQEVAREEVEPLTSPVVAADFVSLEDGTGIVHIAPAFGGEDYSLGKAKGLLYVQQVDLTGNIIGTYPFSDRFVKDADPLITKDLAQRGLLYRQEVVHHTYPFCWRCDTPLLYYAKPSWYIRTTAVKDRLLSGNAEIHWYPEHVKEGRFGEWLRNNVDWAVSRERYWGTPLPIWQCERCGAYDCVGSIQEMRDRMTSQSVTQYMLVRMKQEEDLHRPYVDDVALRCHQCGGDMQRVPDVMDCWFDSGAMPFAQWHYPFEHQEAIDGGSHFPADYICEAVDQTRGWFYSLHALSTLVRGEPCYRNVICLGHILDAKGEKMSKSKGNVVEPWQVIDAHGADAVRWYLFTATPPGNSRRFSTGLVADVVRRFLLPLWNVYSFFVTYANLDQWKPSRGRDGHPAAGLDRWLLSELHILVRDATADMEAYDPTGAGRKIEDFVERLSNWYVRRSRRRFWKSESDWDKLSAYATLYDALVTLAKLLAPFTPFVAEAMYQNLVRSVDAKGLDSVHLAPWPEAREEFIDDALSREVATVRRVTSLGRAARSRAQIKVRQPLLKLLVKPRHPHEGEVLQRLRAQLLEELNVKELEVLDDDAVARFVELRPDVSKLGPRLGDRVPTVREALQQADPAPLYAAITSGQVVEVAGVSVSPEEIQVQVRSADGYAAAAEGGYVVAVSTEIPEDLAHEGLARELVHRLQNMRRSAGFDIADRIVTYYTADERVRQAVQRFEEYVRQETLSQELRQESPPDADVYQEEHKLDGAKVVLGVRRLKA